MFRRALKQLNILPEEALFIGDHPENDVRAAQNIEMKGVWKKDVQWQQVEADFIIGDLSEIPLIIQTINR